ncbi:TetR/AcrR family transcriptional regulator [Corynebacterium durum]|uniref:TetR/AcrR family transcriptional regulator n=1 Tax=Corynebacterium durum TaxID=61592 RepID=UPI002355E5A0|nr:TetR/AcrR family transcriptional regulator [Corynebacterium durum]
MAPKNASQEIPTRTERLPAAERRENMLIAASNVFGNLGYAGATTDAIAKAAGVSQAYVVRTFGSKENLFAEASERAINLIKDTFIRAAQKTKEADTKESMGHAYIELMADRSNLLIVMHLFTMGQHPRFGPIARTGFLEIYRVINDALNMGTEAAKDFLALGMLINVLLGIRLVEVSSAGGLKSEDEVYKLIHGIFQEDTEAVFGCLRPDNKSSET